MGTPNGDPGTALKGVDLLASSEWRKIPKDYSSKSPGIDITITPPNITSSYKNNKGGK